MYKTRPLSAVTTKATVIRVATTIWVVTLLMDLATTFGALSGTIPIFAASGARPRPRRRAARL
jgi:hypothetical protein